MFKKILKFILYTLLYAVIAIALIALFLFVIFPGDINKSLIATGIIFAVVISIVLLRKLYIRLKARAQVKRLVQEENPEEIDELGMSSSELIKDLKKGWKAATRGIKKSNLKLEEGGAIYALPWYMVIGKPRSGKSTALKNAKLLLPDIDLPKQEDGSTLNLDWWLYEQAIVLDTAGRYAVPDNSKRDKKEWSTLLGMLSRHKQKEPINGVVLVVAADRLLNNTEEQLMEEGRQVRSSINELMEQLEVKVPVYLMVTKCDLIEGFDVWSEHLPAESKNQAMGYLHEGSSINLNAIVDKVLSKVLDRVKELRLIMVERSELDGNDLLILPNKIEKIRVGLHHFIESALKENRYQDTPNFRGLFFSSSQKVEDKSGKLTNRGLFLNEFFTKVLPNDRGLLDSLPSAVRTWRTTKRYWISVMGGVGAIALVLISGLYANDMSELRDIKSRYQLIELTHAKQPDSSGNIKSVEKTIDEKIVALYSLRSLILDLQESQKDWVIPWDLINLTKTKKTSDLIASYNQSFKEHVIDVVDHNIDTQIRDSLGEKTSKIAGGIIRRINLLSAEIGNKNNTHDVYLDDKPGIANNFISTAYDQVDYANSELFNELYLSYLNWNTLTLELEDERRTLQSAFRLLVDRNLGNYDWIIDWANQQGYEKFELNNFWSGTVKVANPPIIEAAFTLEGKAFIDEFLNELSESDDQDLDFTDIKADFNTFYDIKYSKAWVTFAERFDEGKGQIRDKKEWISVIGSLSSKDNPYFKFIRTMNTQMTHISETIGYEGQNHFSFFQDVVDASGLGAEAEAADNKALTKLVTKTVGKVCKACKKVLKVGKKVAKATKGGKAIDTDKILDDAVVELEAYNKALYETSFNAESKSQSYSTISTLFTTPDTPGLGDNSMATAYNSITNFQKLIAKPGPNDKLFWALYKGPLGVIYDYMEEENNCYLQEQWDSEVLAQIEDVEEKKLGVFLIGETGLLWDYINGTAAPYLQKKKDKGYIPTSVNTSRQVPWDKNFLKYVNEASAGQTLVGNEFKVKISTIPTGVNQSAAISPYATFLELHCGDTLQSIANYNYTTSSEFTWSLENCGDTTLQIDIGHISLRKKYEGPTGFSQFLHEFRDGRHTFGAADFPNQESLLRKESVSAIDVKYLFENHQPVLRVLDDVPITPPPTVAQCWPTNSDLETK